MSNSTMPSSVKSWNRARRGVLWATMATLSAAATLFALRWGRSAAAVGAPGFREAALESGIDFRMSFLPNEQGETFKVNLYDHGCGLAVADYDGDGDDDVLFLNQLGPNALYRNKGDGTFDDVTDEAGPLAMNDRIKVAAAFGDYDNDNDQDLYITSTRGGNVLLENLGDGHFRDVTDEAGVALVSHSQTPAFFDYDNDGDLDLYVTNTAKWTTDDFDSDAKYYVGSNDPDLVRPRDYEHNVLYRNDGEGHFADVTREARLEGIGWGGDVAAFDYDDDGHLDLLVTNMFGMSQLYHNDGRGRFDDLTRETLRRTSFGAIGCKVFDFDNDGRYFKNQFPRRHYVAFRLLGTKSNHDAIGAVVKLFIGPRVMARQVHATGGYLSQSSKTLHFGLGDDERIDRAEIRWPSGTRQVIESPAVDRKHEISESQSLGR